MLAPGPHGVSCSGMTVDTGGGSGTTILRSEMSVVLFGGLASMEAGAVHAAAAGIHAEHRQLAQLFILVAALQLGVGLWAIVRSSRAAAWAVVVVNAGAIAGMALHAPRRPLVDRGPRGTRGAPVRRHGLRPARRRRRLRRLHGSDPPARTPSAARPGRPRRRPGHARRVDDAGRRHARPLRPRRGGRRARPRHRGGRRWTRRARPRRHRRSRRRCRDAAAAAAGAHDAADAVTTLAPLTSTPPTRPRRATGRSTSSTPRRLRPPGPPPWRGPARGTPPSRSICRVSPASRPNSNSAPRSSWTTRWPNSPATPIPPPPSPRATRRSVTPARAASTSSRPRSSRTTPSSIPSVPNRSSTASRTVSARSPARCTSPAPAPPTIRRSPTGPVR